MGRFMDISKIIRAGGCTNVDPVDVATPAGRSVDEFMLEGVNTTGVFMYAVIRYMAVVVNVSED